MDTNSYVTKRSKMRKCSVFSPTHRVFQSDTLRSLHISGRNRTPYKNPGIVQMNWTVNIRLMLILKRLVYNKPNILVFTNSFVGGCYTPDVLNTTEIINL